MLQCAGSDVNLGGVEGANMTQTRIEFSEEQAQWLTTLATAEQVPVEDLIRRAVDLFIAQSQSLSLHELHLSRPEMWKRSMEILGKYTSESADVSENHDEYLVNLYGA